MAKGNILVAPLNWGLGHASRCIPIVKELEKEGFNPILASDGAALILLQKEFPNLEHEELPSYNIQYPEEGRSFRRKLIQSLPSIRKAISEEEKMTAELVKTYNLQGIISDNRLGVRHQHVPSVIITHQLNVLSGKTTLLSSMIHKYYINQFDECWVPDVTGKKKLSGKMGFTKEKNRKIKYIGPLSRLQFYKTEKRYDILVLLSGPEPQREILEKKLFEEFSKIEGKNILFIKGVMEERQQCETKGSMKVYNFLLGHQMENAINSSELVIARSGYSTVMDMAKLKKQAFFIPTPGQYEQEYLAKRFKKQKIANSCRQEDFSIARLEKNHKYSGFSGFSFPERIGEFFRLFQSE